jgi:predicted transcriptional regulator
MVLSIRMDAETVAQLDELAAAMEGTRANICARALREYVEREYHFLDAVHEGERDVKQGRVAPHERVREWLDRLAESRLTEPPLAAR